MSIHAENELSLLRARGVQHEIGRSPVFDAICEKMAINSKVAPFLEFEMPINSFLRAARSFLGCKVPAKLDEEIKANAHKSAKSLCDVSIPEQFEVLCPPTRNQASCGQCWNLAGIAGGEIATIAANKLDPAKVDWSEQAVVDCVPSGGCDGDWPSTTLDCLKTIGTCDESGDPYRAQSSNGRCPIVNKSNKIADWGYIGDSQGVPSTADIQKAMLSHNCAAVVAVAVDNAWAAYSAGVFRGTGYTGINHAVVIVGWKTIDGVTVWKVRNSWGPSWGDSGYIWMVPGANLIGFGAAWVKAVASPTPVPPTPPPAPPVPQGYALQMDTVTIHTPTFGGTVSFRPTGRIVPLTGLDPCDCQSLGASQTSINWFSLAFDLRKLMADAKGMDFGAAVSAAKQLVADAKSRNLPALIRDLQAVETSLASANWPLLWEDAKKIAADCGIVL